MKLLFTLAFAAVAVAFASPNVQEAGANTRRSTIADVTLRSNEDAAKLPGCYWEGTAPLCKGKCRSGWKEIVRTKCGDGSTCVSGDKAYCCPE
jgi:hypothetical protein